MDYFAPLASYIKPLEQATPEQQQQTALIEALRGMGGQQQGAPAQVGNVVSANGGRGGLQSGLDLGQSLGKLGQGLNNQYNFSTAMQYGTTPGSQQTSMLAAQNAGF